MTRTVRWYGLRAAGLLVAWAALGCSDEVEYADLDRTKTLERLTDVERTALCRETDRRFSAPALLDAVCFGKDPLDRTGSPDEVRARCESQQRACRERPEAPVDCSRRAGCTVTVEQYGRCLEEATARYNRTASEISCAAYVSQPPSPGPVTNACLNDPFDDPCAAFILQCPGLFRPWDNWGRCR